MYPLNIGNSTIYFKNVTIEQLPEILEWYNRIDSFRFATGIDKPINLKALIQKYTEAAICSKEFFVGIYTVFNEKMIGILKGRLHNGKKNAIWINSIVIDPECQNLGYGRMAVNLLLSHFREKRNIKSVYLAVVEENKQGRAFWSRLNFKELRKIENHLKLNDRYWNVIVMHKDLSYCQNVSNNK